MFQYIQPLLETGGFFIYKMANLIRPTFFVAAHTAQDSGTVFGRSEINDFAFKKHRQSIFLEIRKKKKKRNARFYDEKLAT